MKTFLAFLLLTACLITGCAQMGTRQIDRNTTTRYEIDKTGKTNAITTEIRETSTRAKGTALGAGKGGLKGFEAIQGGETQGLKIKESTQQTDGMAQFVETLRAARDIGGMFYGIPPSQPAQPSKPKLQSE